MEQLPARLTVVCSLCFMTVPVLVLFLPVSGRGLILTFV